MLAKKKKQKSKLSAFQAVWVKINAWLCVQMCCVCWHQTAFHVQTLNFLIWFPFHFPERFHKEFVCIRKRLNSSVSQVKWVFVWVSFQGKRTNTHTLDTSTFLTKWIFIQSWFYRFLSFSWIIPSVVLFVLAIFSSRTSQNCQIKILRFSFCLGFKSYN